MKLDCGFVIYAINQIKINKSNIKHSKSKSRKYHEKFSVVVRKYEFIRPELHKADSIFNICALINIISYNKSVIIRVF